MNYSTLYMFSEIKGNWQKLGYVFGIGATNAGYKQATDKYNYWLFRPKLSLNYSVTQALSVRYSFEIFEHISRMAMKLVIQKSERTVANGVLEILI